MLSSTKTKRPRRERLSKKSKYRRMPPKINRSRLLPKPRSKRKTLQFRKMILLTRKLMNLRLQINRLIMSTLRKIKISEEVSSKSKRKKASAWRMNKHRPKMHRTRKQPERNSEKEALHSQNQHFPRKTKLVTKVTSMLVLMT